MPLNRTVHSKIYQRGQKWNDETCHRSNLSILLTYDMIDFPSECSNIGLSSFLFFTVVTTNVYSLGLSGNGKTLTRRRTTEMNTDEIWKCNFPSANHLLKAKVNHQSGNSFVRSCSFRILYLIGQLTSLIKLLDSVLIRAPAFFIALGTLHRIFSTPSW